MRIGKRDLASALLLAVDGKDDSAAQAIIAGFVRRFGPRIGVDGMNRIVEGIPRAFFRMSGIEEVTVETARPIGREETRAAVAACGADPESSEISVRIRPSLIGGFRVIRSDRILDASVRSRIERARKVLAGGSRS
ncbi:F0F1 ATP synthase subunit delta [Candidatus Uhrbacteria bacterium]|nr:F0F1 ATP synthase subunit delta [Candidatus Uhrbacteria bacterium]